MERVSLDSVPTEPLAESSDRVALAPALGAEAVAINRYRIAPGEGFPGGLHAHGDQEEGFVVLAGTATFETYPPLDDVGPSPAGGNGTDESGGGAGEICRVEAGEAVRFAPGEFQSGRNDGDELLVALALGAPAESVDVRLPVPCPTCGDRGLRLETGAEAPTLHCPACEADSEPADCPDCGADDLRATLGPADTPVVGCRACGSRYETPPTRD
jgi:mannose-6-phosphate isomerase-like protein (cupin superfamily)